MQTDHESSIELKDFDTIVVTGHVTAPFSISWSKDDKIALIVDEGVQIFELHPTPLSHQLSITFLRSWIPASTELPFKNAIVDNKANAFVWKLKKKEAYEMALDSTLCTLVEKTTIPSFITECVFSPLICNESYISCLTNNGVLQIYKWDLRKWKLVVNVTNLWIEYCQFRDNGEEVNYCLLKEKIFQMKILTMAWLEMPEPIFVTGHEDGGICIWKVEFLKNSYTMSVQHYFHITGKPSCIGFYAADDQQTIAIVVGTLLGTVKYVVIRIMPKMDPKENKEANLNLQKGSELWKHEDFIKPTLIKSQKVENDRYLFTVKNHILIMQKLVIDENGVVNVLKTDWHEFPSPIISFCDFQDIFVIATRNHDFYSLRISQNGDRAVKVIDVPLKPKHASWFHCYGLAMSKNKAVWVIVSSAKVNYDPKTVKDTNHLLIFTLKQKTFGPLADSSYSGLVRKIAESFPVTKMTEISDFLEMKKCEMLAEPANFSEETSVDISSFSQLRLKLLIWESKFRIYTQSAEVQNLITQCEETIIRRWCLKMREQYLESQTESSDVRKRSFELIEAFLNQAKSSDPAAGSECVVCGAVAPFTNVKVSTCRNSHVFPRCSLSLLPCDSVPYAFCRLCDSTVLVDFKMKFGSRESNFGQSRSEKKNDAKRCEVSNFRDVNELKLKLRMRRSKANARERNRMHGLNKALDRLRSTLPIKTLRSGLGMKHKLSKIETLKIACNYIRLLMNILKSEQEVEVNSFANLLATGLSHATANIVVTSFHQISRFCSGSSHLGFGANLPQQEFVTGSVTRQQSKVYFSH